MSMSQVVEIIGEPHEIMSNNAKINYKNLEVIIYFYNAPSGSSVGVRIYFDAKTKKVVRIECKD